MLPRWSNRAFDVLKNSLSTNLCLRWNHYKALGLPPSASLTDIKAAYYRLSKLHHPDRNNGSPASAKKFRDIVAAYEILSKADSRKKYDREMMKNFDFSKADFMPRKKQAKRNKKNSSSSKIKSAQFKNDVRAKSKYRCSNKLNRDLAKNQIGDFESFLVRTIPLVIACLLCCKKR